VCVCVWCELDLVYRIAVFWPIFWIYVCIYICLCVCECKVIYFKVLMCFYEFPNIYIYIYIYICVCECRDIYTTVLETTVRFRIVVMPMDCHISSACSVFWTNPSGVLTLFRGTVYNFPLLLCYQVCRWCAVGVPLVCCWCCSEFHYTKYLNLYLSGKVLSDKSKHLRLHFYYFILGCVQRNTSKVLPSKAAIICCNTGTLL